MNGEQSPMIHWIGVEHVPLNGPAIADAISPDTTVVAIEMLPPDEAARPAYEQIINERVERVAARERQASWTGALVVESVRRMPADMRVQFGALTNPGPLADHYIGATVDQLDREVPVVTYDTTLEDPEVQALFAALLDADKPITDQQPNAAIRDATIHSLRVVAHADADREARDMPKLEDIANRYGGEVTVIGGLAHGGLASALAANGYPTRVTEIGNVNSYHLQLLRLVRADPEAALPENLLNRDILSRYLIRSQIVTPEGVHPAFMTSDEVARTEALANNIVGLLPDDYVAKVLETLDVIKSSDEPAYSKQDAIQDALELTAYRAIVMTRMPALILQQLSDQSVKIVMSMAG